MLRENFRPIDQSVIVGRSAWFTLDRFTRKIAVNRRSMKWIRERDTILVFVESYLDDGGNINGFLEHLSCTTNVKIAKTFAY